jgi:hypothetical protein
MTCRAEAAGIIASIAAISHAQKAGSRNGLRDSRRRADLNDVFISRWRRLALEPPICTEPIFSEDVIEIIYLGMLRGFATGARSNGFEQNPCVHGRTDASMARSF